MTDQIHYSVGIDIGGTFTDIVFAGTDGSLFSRKTLSTPDDYGRGIADGMREGLALIGTPASSVDRVVHATTVATNAVLEGKGARTALVTTRGFRDVLEMRRLRIPEMYALNYPKPDPLVPRRLRLEVLERMAPDGQIRVPLDEGTVRAAAEQLAGTDIEAVAVSLLHAYANPAHERRVVEILRDVLAPEIFISASSDILPVIREYERTSTTVINAYLGPALRQYFDSLSRHLESIGVDAPLQVMKSDGGVMTVTAAADRPAYIVESGPAAGVIGAARLSPETDQANYITLDMGGTTVKAAIVEGGSVAKTGDYEVGAGINLSSKLVMGGGYALKLPVIDVSEIGSGGGSLVSIDSGGLVRVGPESAGAMPGPVAYDAGGEQTTFTDAALVLGYINADYLVGGGLRLNAEKARNALVEQIAQPLSKDVLDTAHGIFQVACGTMVRAVKAVSTYRGRDPRDFSLFAFGGNGPVVAAEIANLLEMKKIVVPPHPGVFSAHGLLLSNIEHETTVAFLSRLAATSHDALRERLAALRSDLEALMAAEGYGAEDFEASYLADVRYAGQAHELTVPVAVSPMGTPDFDAIARAFGDEHERTYGHKAEAEEVECVTLRVRGTVASETRSAANGVKRPSEAPSKTASRSAYFGPTHGQLDTPVIDRFELEGAGRAGPLIVEEYDSTCVVPPGWHAGLDDRANIVLSAE